jgi:HAD superfamily hydrolase (TIGR01509 family)
LFDEVLDSSIVGVRKPDPLIYRELIRLAGCPANEIMFFDDFEENLPAAAELGIQAIHYTGLDACQDELTRRGLVREADVSEA